MAKKAKRRTLLERKSTRNIVKRAVEFWEAIARDKARRESKRKESDHA